MTTAVTPVCPSASSTDDSGVALTAVEYFAGIGLFRMGLEAAGWRVVFANDWSAERAQMYEGFFGEGYEVRDVFSLSSDTIPQATLATCSFPCIDLSLAGKQQGIHGKHTGAFWGFCDLLEEQGEASPPMVLLENVHGWLYSNGGEDFFATAKALNDLGYACDVFTLNARSFVPQSRPRVFMMGAKGKIGTECADRSRSKRLMPTKLKELVHAAGDIDWMQLDIPEPPLDLSRGFSSDIVENLSGDSSRWWSQEKVDKHLGMMSPRHLETVEIMAKGDRKVKGHSSAAGAPPDNVRRFERTT